MNIEIPFIDPYLCSFVILSLPIFTPIQSREMFKVELLNKYGSVERLPGYGFLVVEPIADLALVCLLACLRLLFYMDIIINSQLLFVMIVISMGLLGAFFLLVKYPLKRKLALFIQSIQKASSTSKYFQRLCF